MGTYDEVFGPGSTPLWALPTDTMKYQDTQIVEEEAGFILNIKVISYASLPDIAWHGLLDLLET